jgi:hypothetical protein
MSEAREPTEDELIDYMDWLIDHVSESIDMGRIEVTDEELESFSEEKFGPPSGMAIMEDTTDPENAPICRWWDGKLYVADMGDIRLVYRP